MVHAAPVTKMDGRAAATHFDNFATDVVAFKMISGTDPSKIGFDRIAGLSAQTPITPVANVAQTQKVSPGISPRPA